MFGIEIFALALALGLAYAMVSLHQLRQRLERREAELAAFVKFSSDWAWEQDEHFRFTRFYGGSYERHQLDLGHLFGKTRWEHAELVVAPELMQAHRQACERHEAFHDFQYGVRFPNGAMRWFVSSGYPVFDEAGAFRGYRGLAREDTVRMQAERALRRSEQQLAAIAAGSPVPMFALDASGRVILWNRGCELVLGVPASDMLGRRDPWRAFYPAQRPVLAHFVSGAEPPERARELYGERMRPVAAIPGALEAEGFFPAMAGRDRWLHFLAAPMRDEDGQIIGAIETLQDITERKLAEDGLAERNARLTALIDNIPGGVSLVDAELRVVAWNRRFLELLDLPEALFAHPPVNMESVIRFNAERGEYGLGSPEQQVREAMQRAARGEPHIVERTRPDGTVLEIRGAPMPGGGFVTIYSDITARKAAEEKLRLQSTYLNAVIEHLPQGISVFDQELRLKHWNARLGEILEIPPELLHADARFEDMIRVPALRGEYGPGDPEAQVRERRALALRFEPHGFERTRANGKTHLVEGRPMFVDGRIAGFLTTYTDITGRRENERLLERQRGELETAQRIAHVGSWRWPAGSALPECSAEMLRLLRVDATHPLPSFGALLRRVRREDRRSVLRAARALLHRGAPLDLICRFGRPSAAVRHLHVLAQVERDGGGELAVVVGTAQDVTELREAEAALRASSAMFSTIFEEGPLPLALIRLDGERLAMANTAWLQQFSPDGAQVLGHALDESGVWPDHGRWEILCERLRSGSGLERFEAQLAGREGQALICEISGRAVTLGEDAMLLASFIDVTEERRIRGEIEALNARLEERVAQRTAELTEANQRLALLMAQLVQSEKLASLGGLVAGIAHELNTPLGNALTVATSFSERMRGFGAEALAGRLRRSMLEDFVHSGLEAADLIERNLGRAAQQVAHFKQVAVDQTSERRRRFDLRATIEEIVVTLRPRLRREPHVLEVEVPAGILMDSYPGPLEQVVGNLVENALNHAFAGRPAGRLQIRAQVCGAERVCLEISDDGCGMSAEVRAHAFDPFFTTRLGQGGSGLGLYIVYNLVSGPLGGSIRIEAEPGGGSRFLIELPLSAPRAELEGAGD